MSAIAIPLSQLAALVNGSTEGEEVTITGVNTIDGAAEGQIAFVDRPELLAVGERSAAAALIVSPSARTSAKPIIVTEDPRLAFSKVLEIFAPQRRVHEGVHPTAVVGSKVKLGENISIGAHAFVGDHAVIEDGAVIHPLAYIGHDVTIGADTEIHPQAYIGERVIVGAACIIHAGAVIGCDGFGYLQQPSGHRKIPQIGIVIIEDNVEIGANSTIDRATISATIIGAGTKFDDAVHIAHNCVIGKNCLFAAQVGIAGSTEIGDYVIMGGQVGVNDHVRICGQTIFAGQAGVFADVDEPGTYSGYPARQHRNQLRVLAAAQKLPETICTIRDLEARIAQLEARLSEARQ
ncbi:MAG: UDP-3-O-(3-hydroxymyristoyl)glucosamine N-acyltransferase [Armatimonadota bacterium]